jgi:hypothetical protein
MPSFILLWLLRQPASLFHEVAGIISSTLLDSMSDLTNQIRKKEKKKPTSYESVDLCFDSIKCLN